MLRASLILIVGLAVGCAITPTTLTTPRYKFGAWSESNVGVGSEVLWAIGRRDVRISERRWHWDGRKRVEKRNSLSKRLSDEDATVIAAALHAIPEDLWDSEVTAVGLPFFSHHPWYRLTVEDGKQTRSISMGDGAAIRELRVVAERINRLLPEEKRLHIVYLESDYIVRRKPNKAPEPTPGSVTPRAIEGVSK